MTHAFGDQVAAQSDRTRAPSPVAVVSADSKPRPVLADDPLKLSDILRQARHIPNHHQIRETNCNIRQDLPAPT